MLACGHTPKKLAEEQHVNDVPDIIGVSTLRCTSHLHTAFPFVFRVPARLSHEVLPAGIRATEKSLSCACNSATAFYLFYPSPFLLSLPLAQQPLLSHVLLCLGLERAVVGDALVDGDARRERDALRDGHSLHLVPEDLGASLSFRTSKQMSRVNKATTKDWV